MLTLLSVLLRHVADCCDEASGGDSTHPAGGGQSQSHSRQDGHEATWRGAETAAAYTRRVERQQAEAAQGGQDQGGCPRGGGTTKPKPSPSRSRLVGPLVCLMRELERARISVNLLHALLFAELGHSVGTRTAPRGADKTHI